MNSVLHERQESSRKGITNRELKTTQIYSPCSGAWESEIKMSQGHGSLSILRRGLFLPLVASGAAGHRWRSWACGHITLVSASSLYVCVFSPSFLL